jgi:Fe(3+) dicitrate transport protein
MDPRFRILYKISDYNIFTSVHKGFSPPGIKTGEDAENSLNTELGFRFDKGALHGGYRVLQQFLESARF